ncbi:Rne/Rng family ribonuclease [Paenibacillus cymbidii]|uniref:Rne/Rng family ribonuclease n=1 Tax=Paenibacillus cymbidii TaxID=1639034 RepID=UPI0010812EFA|nr:Rne/Rng family ribonuclease [Paenibacillus cymbidii]
MKRIVVQAEHGCVKVALLEYGQLVELYMEHPQQEQRAGNVYKGRVVNVLPGMQAAFVDIGLGRNAFLYVDDLLPAHADKQPAAKKTITDLVKPGDQLLVQVKKEAAGTKGARVTTHVTLPGRWVVYLPQADYVAVSRKIEADAERARLKEIGDRVRGESDGIIFRTVSAGETENALRHDFESLRELWTGVLRTAETCKAPSLVYRDLDMLPRLLRDLVAPDVDELVVNDAKVAAELRRMIGQTYPPLAERVVESAGEPPFLTNRIAEEAERAYKRKVWLPSGGYIVIDQTEALTVVDVNTGKFIGEDDLEETVFRANAEAARELARLLRLRDIGGIVIVDFIDMEQESHRQAIADLMHESVKRDRTKTNVVGWTKLGLLELTRRKVRRTLADLIYEPCPHCSGYGKAFVKPFPV